ncbi:prolipoprotein diacylglyceryl transferase [Mesorhizobium sp.]|uniref:prolipoprotein diacylglyceryl transferase n=1 Tax=Mesorhizobium sp. TaxID=1871066 RepID=UPI0011FCF42A|nr:prolipoprotein diacylglyceryl transferase [Mesorhizobium sp.]TIM05507.1 MAG: prolipoprotein diacylglyceryl transferase [Mesorhizobium sp.]
MPLIDPVAFNIGPLAVRWYGLLFASGIALAWLLMRVLARSTYSAISARHIDAVMFWITIGVTAGGRAGNLVFYEFGKLKADPGSLFDFRQGGMAFFGGLIGVAVALILYTRWHRLPLLQLADITAAAAPAGLCLGRIGNFLNGELYGPETGLPWGLAFTHDGYSRHPTQLYEAGLEGVVLFVLLYPAACWGHTLAYPGRTVGLFMSLYALFRVAVEVLRVEYDPLRSAGYPLSISQLLCIPMLMIGIALIWQSRSR